MLKLSGPKRKAIITAITNNGMYKENPIITEIRTILK